MKHISALAAALIITMVIGFGVLVIGVSALTNKNTVALQNSPNASLNGNNVTNTSSNSNGSSGASSSDVQQLQQEVSSLQSQLNQENQAIQQYQSLLSILQQRGVIRIDSNGNIYIPEGSDSIFH